MHIIIYENKIVFNCLLVKWLYLYMESSDVKYNWNLFANVAFPINKPTLLSITSNSDTTINS